MVLPAPGGDWFALFTKGRHEKAVLGELGKRRIEAFLPLRKIRRKWSDRAVTIEEPLFKSYLFVRTERARALDALRVPGAVRFVSAAGAPVPVRPSVVESLRCLVETGIAIDAFPYLSAGDRVAVQSGIFKGIEGFIVRKDEKKCRVVISVDALMTSLSVEVDSCLVEKI